MDATTLREILKDENKALEERIMKKLQVIIKEEYEKINKTVEEQNIIIEQLKLENQDMKKRMNTMEQYSRRSNVQINNIPVTPNENVETLVCEIGEKIGVPIKYDVDIQAAHRVPSKSETNKPIIVKFSNRGKRDAFIIAARTAKLKCGQLEANQDLLFSSENKIYVNDHLTLQNMILFSDARKAVKEKKLKSAWTRSGNIYVRRDASSQPMQIFDKEDLRPFLVPYSHVTKE